MAQGESDGVRGRVAAERRLWDGGVDDGEQREREREPVPDPQLERQPPRADRIAKRP